PDERERRDVAGQLVQEQHEGTLRVYRAVFVAVRVVRVDGEPHLGRRAILATASSGGPNRAEPARKPSPQEVCMRASTAGTLRASPGDAPSSRAASTPPAASPAR